MNRGDFMKLEMFQSVRLKTGQRAVIVEIYNDGEAYEMDVTISEAIITTDPPILGKYETRTIYPNEISSIFTEVEEPFVTA